MKELKKIIQSIISIYGFIQIDYFIKLYYDYTKIDLSNEDLINSINELNNDLLDKHISIYDRYMLDKSILDDINYFNNLIKYSEEKPYCIFTYDELISYSEIDFLRGIPAYINLFNYIKKNFNKSDEFINNILLELYRFCRMYTDIFELTKLINLRIPATKFNYHIKPIDKILTYITNSTGKWMNRGYSPSQIHNMEKDNDNLVSSIKQSPASSYKISRNSLCNCGSGKKYKKCCGA